MSNLRESSEGKGGKLLVNVAMSVLLYGAPIWADAINARQYRRTEMVSVQQKAALRCVSAYRIVSTEVVCVLAGIPPIEIVADERRRVYSATRWVKLKSAKALWVRREERQVMLRKWKERLSESSKGQWTRLLIRNLDAWLERGHGQMNFYLTQVMSGQGAFNAYLFRMKLADSPSAPTAIQEGEMMTPGTLVRVSGILTVPGGGDDCCRKDGRTASYAGQFGPDYAEKGRRMGPGGCFCRSDNAPQDGDSAGAAGAAHSRHSAPNAGPCHPPIFAVSNPATKAEDDPGQSTSKTSGSQFTI